MPGGLTTGGKIMRFSPAVRVELGSMILLAACSCSSQSKSWPVAPRAAQLTDAQAATLAQQYLDQQAIAAPRLLSAEQRQPDGWWMWYQTPFDPTAHPSKLSYVVQVHNDGTVQTMR